MVSAPLPKLKLNDAELPIGELKTAASVDLSGKNLQPTDAIIIAKLMSMVNAPLTDLNIRWNDIGDEGAKALAAALPRKDAARRALSTRCPEAEILTPCSYDAAPR